MVNSEATRVTFRPTRSPKWPNSAEPIGRATKAMAKVVQRLQGGRSGIALREKDMREDDDRGGGIDVEVEKLNGGANERGDNNLVA